MPAVPQKSAKRRKRVKVIGKLANGATYTRRAAMRYAGIGINTLLEWEDLGLPWIESKGFIRYRGRDLNRFLAKYAKRKSANWDATDAVFADPEAIKAIVVDAVREVLQMKAA